MSKLTWAGIGCGCLPALLLLLGCAVCFVLVAVGAINYSEEDTVMIVGAVLLVFGTFFGSVGSVLVLVGFLRSRGTA